MFASQLSGQFKMSGMQRQYADSTKLMARAMLHIKYGPRGTPWSLADAGKIKGGDRVLDIGCGPGRFWAANAQTLPAGLDLVLADLSPGMVAEAVANVRAANGGWASVSGETADVCALPFADDSFDAVTAMHMLYHAPDKDLAVAEIARVLKPDGVLIATTNGTHTMKEFNALSHAVFGTPDCDFGSASFSLESGEPILRRHFRTVAIKAATDVLRVTDPQDIVNALRSFPPGDTADAATLRFLEDELAAHGGAGRRFSDYADRGIYGGAWYPPRRAFMTMAVASAPPHAALSPEWGRGFFKRFPAASPGPRLPPRR